MESKSCFFRGSIPQIIHLGFFRGLVYIFSISDLYSFSNRHNFHCRHESANFASPGFSPEVSVHHFGGDKKNQPPTKKIGITISVGENLNFRSNGGLWKFSWLWSMGNSWIQQVMGG